MFKQIFETVALPYRSPDVWAGIPSGIGLSALFNAYLVTAPRIYAEEIDFPLALYSRTDPTASSETTITLIAALTMIYWPGTEYLALRFDGQTGAFIDRTEIGGDLLTGILHMDSITQGFDGSLWASYSLGEIREFDLTTFTLMQTVPASRFGRASTAQPIVDKSRDLIVMPEEVGSGIVVYTLSTGTVVRHIATSGTPISLCAEDDKRLYVMGSNYVLNLINYTTGEIMSTHACPEPPAAAYVMTTWDRGLRRLLAFAQVANASDGSSQSTTRGFYPVPLATHLCAPIPLVAPRRGRQIPVLLRAVGDVGEPLTGVNPQLIVSGSASLAAAPQGTDGNGNSIARILCVSPGSATLTATAPIDD
jgi:hypothetical protein